MQNCSECNLKSKMVAILNEEEILILEDGCYKSDFEKGETIVREGMPAQYTIYIRDGFIKQYKKGPGMKEHILSISKAGSYVGIQNLAGNSGTYYFSAKTLTHTKVCFINIDSFKNLVIQNGGFALSVISHICKEETEYFNRLINNVSQQLNGRLANILLYLKNEVYNENPFCLHMTKSELASFIGTSRESVSRLLKEFSKDKIIAADKQWIKILNEQKLNEIKWKG